MYFYNDNLIYLRGNTVCELKNLGKVSNSPNMVCDWRTKQ